MITDQQIADFQRDGAVVVRGVFRDWVDIMADGIEVATETLIAAEAFGVDGFPFTTLLDAEGAVVARWSGGREPDEIIAHVT